MEVFPNSLFLYPLPGPRRISPAIMEPLRRAGCVCQWDESKNSQGMKSTAFLSGAAFEEDKKRDCFASFFPSHSSPANWWVHILWFQEWSFQGLEGVPGKDSIAGKLHVLFTAWLVTASPPPPPPSAVWKEPSIAPMSQLNAPLTCYQYSHQRDKTRQHLHCTWTQNPEGTWEL